MLEFWPQVLVTRELAAVPPTVWMPSIHYFLGNSLVNEHRMTLRTKEIHKPEVSKGSRLPVCHNTGHLHLLAEAEQ